MIHSHINASYVVLSISTQFVQFRFLNQLNECDLAVSLEVTWFVFILLRFFYFLSVGWCSQRSCLQCGDCCCWWLLALVAPGSTVSRGSSLPLRTLPVSPASARNWNWLEGRKEGARTRETRLAIVLQAILRPRPAILLPICDQTSVTPSLLQCRWSPVRKGWKVWSIPGVVVTVLTVKLWLSWQKTRLVTRDIVT